MPSRIASWNRVPDVAHARTIAVQSRFDALPDVAGGDHLLAYGNGRSYGDVCLNPDRTLLLTRRLDRFIAFDRVTGDLICEAGVTLAEILAFAVPMGWFLAVTPGTRFVTLGGAIANDVHGKNHHAAGTFGHHVRALELLRSDGARLQCSPHENPEMFAATIGGLGLTGLITSAQIRLVPVANAFMVTQAHRFASLAAFWELNARLEPIWPYTVAWIDCTHRDGRGILFTGTHAPAQSDLPVWREKARDIPVTPPVSLVNGLSLKAFNSLYYHRRRPTAKTLVHHVPYFYPLDAVRRWNRIYGPRGFFQYQCVLPPPAACNGIGALLGEIAASGSGSFLAVLKTFGDRTPAGLLSFARPGATLALDFPNHGLPSETLFRRLDAIVRATGGALYPAKDARMPADLFRAGFPNLDRFAPHIDPAFSSGFWRRVTGDSSPNGDLT